MALSSPLLQAVRRYGPSVQGVAHQYGISGEALLAKLIQGESGGSATATSKAGAKGYTQFMPGTRRISIDRYGIDPLAGPDAAVHAAALHLRGKLTGAKGLQGYNPGGGQGYVDYILGQHVGDVGGRSGGGSSGSDSGGLATALTGSVTPGQVAGGGFDPGPAGGVSLADLISSRPQPVAPQLPAAPFSPSKYLHLGQSPVVAQSQQQASGSGIDSLLAAMQGSGQEIPQTSVSAAQTSVSGSAPTAHASSASGGSGRMPTARAGKIIGTPYVGTHTLGNWQSDRAVDIAVPKGTPMVALQDGVVEKVTRHPQGAGRFAGDQITVRGANGNEYFYAHGVAGVKAGQRISKGQRLGVTGSANGVEHLHFAQRKGDVFQHVRGR